MADYVTKQDFGKGLGIITDQLNTVYGKTIENQKKTIKILTEYLVPRHVEMPKDTSHYVSNVISEVFPYELEWGRYDVAEKPPAQAVIGDIFNTNNITSVVGDLMPGTINFMIKMFGKDWKSENVYSKAMEFVDNSRAGLSGIYERRDEILRENSMIDNLSKYSSENLEKLESSLEGGGVTYRTENLDTIVGPENINESNDAGISYNYDTETGNHEETSD